MSENAKTLSLSDNLLSSTTKFNNLSEDQSNLVVPIIQTICDVLLHNQKNHESFRSDSYSLERLKDAIKSFCEPSSEADSSNHHCSEHKFLDDLSDKFTSTITSNQRKNHFLSSLYESQFASNSSYSVDPINSNEALEPGKFSFNDGTQAFISKDDKLECIADSINENNITEKLNCEFVNQLGAINNLTIDDLNTRKSLSSVSDHIFKSFKLILQFLLTAQLQQDFENYSSQKYSKDLNFETNESTDNSVMMRQKNERVYYDLIIFALITSLINVLEFLMKTYLLAQTSKHKQVDYNLHLVIHKCQSILLGTITYLQHVYFNDTNVKKDLPILSHIVLLCSLLQSTDNFSQDNILQKEQNNISKVFNYDKSESNTTNSLTKSFNSKKTINTSNQSELEQPYNNDGCYAFDAQLKTHKLTKSPTTTNAVSTGRGFKRSSTEFLCTYPGVSWNTRMQSWLVYYEDAKGRKSRTFNPKRLTSNQLNVLPPHIRAKYSKDPVATAMHCACAYAAKVRWEGKLRKSMNNNSNKSFQTPKQSNGYSSSETFKCGDSLCKSPSSFQTSIKNSLPISAQEYSEKKEFLQLFELSSFSSSTQPSEINSPVDFSSNDLTASQLLAIGLNGFSVEGSNKRRRRENSKIK